MADGDFDPLEARSRARGAINALLLDTIRRDTYPSPTMMSIVESQMSGDELPEYLDVLMDKIDGDRFPSLDMIRRVLALT